MKTQIFEFEIFGIYGKVEFKRQFETTMSQLGNLKLPVFNNDQYIANTCIKIRSSETYETINEFEIVGLPFFMTEEQYYRMAKLEYMKIMSGKK